MTSTAEHPELTGSILFVGHRNAGLSQMAEAFARRTAPGVTVASVGIEPSDSPDPRVLSLMDDHFGIDLAVQAVNSSERVNDRMFDIVVTLGEEARKNCPQFPGAPARFHWDIDEELENDDDYRAAAEEIRRRVGEIFSGGSFRALVEQRQTYLNILNSLSEAVVAHDLNRRIYFVTPGITAITGKSPSEIVGQDCHEVFAPHLCSRECVFHSPQVPEELVSNRYTTVVDPPDGDRRELTAARWPLKDTEGNLTGALLVLNDQTYVRQLERRLEERQSFRGIIGQDHAMQQIYDLIRDCATSDFSVIVSGESGTGKELVAMAIHEESDRRDNLFVPVNCGALPEALLESELFGHVKGAFTGAIRDKRGRFDMADKGTLFLDEIAELSPAIQVKLLRVLQQGTFEPVGSETPRTADVRVISATNRDLRKMVAEGTFREDLYYRLAVIPIDLPPLRERRNDIPLLTDHFLRLTAQKLKRPDVRMSDESLTVFMDHPWPGNVRQLHNAIQFSLVKCRGELVEPGHLPPEVLAEVRPPLGGERDGGWSRAGRRPKLGLGDVEEALRRSGGNKAKAARMLGAGRATLYNFIKSNHAALQSVLADDD